MNYDHDLLREQAKAIREQAEKRPEPRKETAREARWRVELERKEAKTKRHPLCGY
jgi:hypothetical protein